MATKKVYDSDEILKMSEGFVEPDVEADKSVKNNAGSVGNAGISMNSASDDWFKKSNAYQNQADAIYKNIQDQISKAGNTNNENIYAVSDAYQKQADEIYKKLQETPDFSYDFNEDAVFQALREQYMKDGKLAAENVAGQAAALSGGYGNSYGTTAAGQAYMGAIDDLYSNVPELQEAAYGRYQDNRNSELQNWEIMQNRADAERDYAQTERDYNDNREAYLLQLALQNWETMQNRADTERAYAQDERAYQDSQTALSWEQALQKAELGDYSGLKALGVDTSNSEYESKLNNALTLAEFGDYSALKALGVDTSRSEYALNLNNALALAEVGDYSGLKALGVDVSSAEKQNTLDFALAAAEFGDYSFLKALGIDTSALEKPANSYVSSSGGTGNTDDLDDVPKQPANDVPKQPEIDTITTRMAELLDTIESNASTDIEKARAEKQLQMYYKKFGG